MAVGSMRCSLLLVLGHLVIIAGGMGWFGGDTVSASRIGAAATAVARKSSRAKAANESFPAARSTAGREAAVGAVDDPELVASEVDM
ncbi:hypothetical protein C4D60_Mb08t12130 [Musa balbisiana]|uniref:Uncharacterized protein n=1 Tax=Musa balbisiana TaxID=52838 RepID=A0A4S8K362_MUSBA|nr:hypothetical protein C4D60_Mb08t12130 [Musa balbisiana]